jgi:hypothetical protein
MDTCPEFTLEEIKKIEKENKEYRDAHPAYRSVWILIRDVYRVVEDWYYQHTAPYYLSKSGVETNSYDKTLFNQTISGEKYIEKFIEESELTIFDKKNIPEWARFEIMYRYAFKDYQDTFPDYFWGYLEQAKEWLLKFHKLIDGDREDFLLHVLTGAHLVHSTGRILEEYNESISLYEIYKVCNEGLRSVFAEEEIGRFLNGESQYN